MLKLEKLRLNFIFHSVSRPRGRTEIQSKTLYTDEMCDRSTRHTNVARRYTDYARPAQFVVMIFIYQKLISLRKGLT